MTQMESVRNEDKMNKAFYIFPTIRKVIVNDSRVYENVRPDLLEKLSALSHESSYKCSFIYSQVLPLFVIRKVKNEI
jgi:hypothetical protein